MKKNPHILMLGWEFPPVFSGGLGIVTKSLLESLLADGADVTLLLPSFIGEQARKYHPDMVGNFDYNQAFEKQVETILSKKVIRVSSSSLLSPYLNRNTYLQEPHIEIRTIFGQKSCTKKNPLDENLNKSKKKLYGSDLFGEIDRFAAEAVVATEGQNFDLVHAHDWITAEAALQLKFKRKIPFVLQVHATEYDRIGHEPEGSEVFRREKYAMEQANKVITVSHYTKGILERVYGIDGQKISVVHNAYDDKDKPDISVERWDKDKSKFWVLFIGRITLQKGPDYFLEAAKKVMEVDDRVHFLIAGDGDMLPHVVETIAKERLYKNVHCLGFLTPEDRDALYVFTDACVIPSVSEPFGLTAIEAVFNKSPLILAKTCGANEIIHDKLSIDYWDTDQMAEYILSLAKYPALRRTLRERAIKTLPPITWATQAQQVRGIYGEVL
jgi:glycogen(starch) synthase